MKSKHRSLDIFAHGGEVVTSRSRFMKTLDSFRDDSEKTNFKKVGKGGTGAKMSGETKSQPLPKKGKRS